MPLITTCPPHAGARLEICSYVLVSEGICSTPLIPAFYFSEVSKESRTGASIQKEGTGVLLRSQELQLPSKQAQWTGIQSNADLCPAGLSVPLNGQVNMEASKLGIRLFIDTRTRVYIHINESNSCYIVSTFVFCSGLQQFPLTILTCQKKPLLHKNHMH